MKEFSIGSFTRMGLLLGGILAASIVPGFAGTVTYTYDALGRLKTADYGNNVVIEYKYDPAGNRTQVIVGASPPPSSGSTWGQLIWGVGKWSQ
jgi:hypothetical protein